ncbi:MAG: hypothetical protein NVS3B25_33590 [Hymenobacter sp.]
MTTRPATRFTIVNPMTAGEQSGVWASKKAAAEARDEQRLSGEWVVMTEKQWSKFLGQCQKPGLTEGEQRTLVSSIVGYDY